MKLDKLLAAALLAVSSTVFAQTAALARDGSAGTHGEIRKVDKDAGKLTIRHEALTNLDMPAMTMVFRVADPGMLDAVKQGDEVLFVAEKVGGQFTVTRLEQAQPKGH